MKEFDLETILTIITGINLTDDFNKVFELAKYIYDDEFINDSAISYLRNDMKEHLLNIHPKLGNIGYIPQTSMYLDIWIGIQKDNFGEYLSVSPKGQSLKKYKK